MFLYIVWGSDAQNQIQQATNGNEPEEARKIAQSVEQGNRIVESWLLSKGGRMIAYEGGNGSAEIDAEHLGEVRDILEQFSKAIREGRVWAGVGTELKEADIAAKVAHKRGGENTIVLYTPEVAQELETDDDPTSDDMLLDGLTKFDQQAPEGEATAVERGQAAPPSPMSVASQGASQLPDVPGQENRPAGPEAPQAGQPQNSQQLKQAIVEVLKNVRSQVPFFEKVKEQNPSAYEAVMGLVEALMALAKQVMGPSAPTPQETGLGKSEAALKVIFAHDPKLGMKLAALVKALKPRVQGSGHFIGPLENFDAEGEIVKEEPEGTPGLENQFEQVPPEEYESVISSRADQGGLATDRDYTGKKTFLNKTRTAGVTVDPRTGELQYLFSLAKGHGVPAMRFGIQQGGTNLDCFDGGLVKLYSKHGWKEVRREPNWTPGGPDVVFMKYQPDAPKGVEPPLRMAEKLVSTFEQTLAKMAVIHDNRDEPMTVYRIQNKEGYGPYAKGPGSWWERDPKTSKTWYESNYYIPRLGRNIFNPTVTAVTAVTGTKPKVEPRKYIGEQPIPEAEFGLKDYKDFINNRKHIRFGFDSEEALRNWFGSQDYLDHLESEGFKVTPVKASKVWRSKHGKQVFFIPHGKEPQPDLPGIVAPLRRSEELGKAMVWRVQNAQGEGPYVTGADYQDNESGNAPDPTEDFDEKALQESGYNPDDAGMIDWFEGRASGRTNKGPKFGFAAKEHAVPWFTQEGLDRLAAQGYNLTQVPADKVWVSRSGKQVMYHPPVTKKSESADCPDCKGSDGEKIHGKWRVGRCDDCGGTGEGDCANCDGPGSPACCRCEGTGKDLEFGKNEELDSETYYHGTTERAWKTGSGDTLYLTTKPKEAWKYADDTAVSEAQRYRSVRPVVFAVTHKDLDGLVFEPDWGAVDVEASTPWTETKSKYGSFAVSGDVNGRKKVFKPIAKNEEPDPTKLPPKGSKLIKDMLPGGLADKADPKQFPKDLLMEGAKHEMEHTDDPRIATEIAMDHLKEDPLYYRKLKAAGLDKGELEKKGLLAAMSAAGTKDSRKGDIAKPVPVFKEEPNPTHHNLNLPVGTVLNGTGRQGGGAARAKAGIVIEQNAEGKKVHRQQRRGRRMATDLEGGASESAQNKPPPTEQPGPTERKGTAVGDGQG